MAKDSSNAHLMACNSVAQGFADARLNSVYQAWIDFRDKDCSLQSTSMLGGTDEPNVYGDCLYTMTKARVQALEANRKAR